MSTLTQFVDAIELAVIFLPVALLSALAYWRGDKPLFLLAGFGLILYGFLYFSALTYFSFVSVLAGMFMCFRAFSKRGAA